MEEAGGRRSCPKRRSPRSQSLRRHRGSPVSPREVRSLLSALVYLGQRIDQILRDSVRQEKVSTDAEFEAALIDAVAGGSENLAKLLLHKHAVRAKSF